ncbi:MAG TPA: hypothetical protein VGM41_12645 [Chitinophagaceae bacterium]|jgi:hypothetical protein
MQRLFLFMVVLLSVVLIAGCRGNRVPDECDFTGTWVKGDKTGDTLLFFTQNGINLLRYRNPVNPVNPNQPVYSVIEYTCRNEALYVENYLSMTAMVTFVEARGFKWIVPGHSFSIQVSQVQPFLEDSQVLGTYVRL